MKSLIRKLLFLYLSSLMAFVFLAGCRQQQNADTGSLSGKVDLQKIRITIEALDKQFSKDFYNGDSVALANYYSSDAKFGSLKGKDILSAWGRMIRNSVKDSTRNLLFTTTAFTGDSDYMVELGN